MIERSGEYRSAALTVGARPNAFMKTPNIGWRCAALVYFAATMHAATNADGWHANAQRDEIMPAFAFESTAGPIGRGALVITTDQRSGLAGHWAKTFPVVGGQWYEFRARRKAHHVPNPERNAHIEIAWSDEAGGKVLRDEGDGKHRYALETFPQPAPPFAYVSRPEFPREGATDAQGWTELTGRFCAPPKASRAKVELHLRWAANAKVEWSDISLVESSAPGRKVTLATVHMRGAKAKSAAQACAAYAPLIEEAAGKGANFVCLTEAFTSHFSGLSFEQAAEPIPGPSTKYFEGVARKHDLYVIAGLVERAGHLIYNTSALIGPEGYLGKYRKVCLTRDEGNGWGVSPGDSFPVFETRFGKVGMMICWDLQHPEAARALAAQGAEIIFLPIAGGNPALAAARAIENQIFLVTSAWNSKRVGWLKTGIYDYDGKLIASVQDRGIAIAEVDLDAPRYWANLGDLKGQIIRQRPVVEAKRIVGRRSLR